MNISSLNPEAVILICTLTDPVYNIVNFLMN